MATGVDEQGSDFVDGGQPESSSVVVERRPGRLIVAALIVTGLAASFALGRWSISSSDQTAESPTTDPTIPDTDAPATAGSDTDQLATSLFDLDTVIGAVESPSGVLVALGCDTQETEDDQDNAPTAIVVGRATEVDGAWRVQNRQPLYPPSRTSCCGGEVVENLLGDRPGVLAHCLIGGSDGLSSVVVAGEPENGWQPNGLLLNVSCGGTSAEVVPGGLRVSSVAGKAGAAQPSAAHPTIDLQWSGERFWAEDDDQSDLYEWFCDENTGAWVDGYLSHPVLPERARPTDSQLGRVMVLGPVVFGEAGPQCSALSDAWASKAYGQSRDSDWDGDSSPIATALGLPPPGGMEDWLFDCYDHPGYPITFETTADGWPVPLETQATAYKICGTAFFEEDLAALAASPPEFEIVGEFADETISSWPELLALDLDMDGLVETAMSSHPTHEESGDVYVWAAAVGDERPVQLTLAIDRDGAWRHLEVTDEPTLVPSARRYLFCF